MNSSSGLKFFSSPKLPSSIYTVVVDVVARKKKEKKWGHLLFFALDPPFFQLRYRCRLRPFLFFLSWIPSLLLPSFPVCLCLNLINQLLLSVESSSPPPTRTAPPERPKLFFACRPTSMPKKGKRRSPISSITLVWEPPPQHIQPLCQSGGGRTASEKGASLPTHYYIVSSSRGSRVGGGGSRGLSCIEAAVSEAASFEKERSLSL